MAFASAVTCLEMKCFLLLELVCHYVIDRLRLTALTTSNVTEEEAYDNCRTLIINKENLGSSCLESSLQNPNVSEQMVQMCASDVLVTHLQKNLSLFINEYCNG